MERELRQRRPLNRDNDTVNNGNNEKVHSKGKFDNLELRTFLIIFS